MRKRICDGYFTRLLMTLLQLAPISIGLGEGSSIIEIVEELAPGTVIIDNVHRRLQLSPSTPSSYAAIGNPASPGISSLEIRPHRFDGTLQLVVKDGHRGPDREELCNLRPVNQFASSQSCDITLVIVHGNRQNPSYAKVTLRILDVNDNAPVFSKGDQFEVRIPEDPGNANGDEQAHLLPALPRSMKYPLPLAYDPDLNENAVRYYRLTTKSAQEIDNSLIILTNQNDADSTSPHDVYSPALKVIGPLDREKVSDYWFILLALDGGSPQKTGTLTIHVIVTDLNDNKPRFRAPVYHYPTFISTQTQFVGLQNPTKCEILRVPESVAVGTDLVSLSAEDVDEGINAQLTYRMKEPLSDQRDTIAWQCLQLIRVNDVVKLRVSKQLDADNLHGKIWSDAERDLHGNLIPITVEVSDGGSPPLSSTITVHMLIENVNDNRPEIAVQFVNPVQTPSQRKTTLNVTRFAGSLKENLSGPNTIAHVTVTDADRIVSLSHLDGRLSQIRDGVRCDLNDTRFSLESVPSLSSQFVPEITSATSVSHSFFYRLSALTTFDREESDWIRILVSCVDQVNSDQTAYGFDQTNHYRSGNRLTGSVLISLQITDLNDNPPRCSMERYRFSVPETPTTPGVYIENLIREDEKLVIGHVKAIDLDIELNGLVRYKLLTNPYEAFKIDATDGTLWRVGQLDREKDAHVELKVEVYDQGSPSLSSTCLVLVDILDVNDHPPYWVTSLADDDMLNIRWSKTEDGVFYFSIPEDTEVGQPVGMITAVDVDGFAQNELSPLQLSERLGQLHQREGKLLYQLEPAEEAAVFSINRRTGELRLSRKLDRETRAHYEIRAFAIDSTDSIVRFPLAETNQRWTSVNSNRFTVTATVFITVLDVNDNAPQFESPLPGQEFHIDPTGPMATPGTTLFTAVAHDADIGENATVRYALKGSGYGLVEIDAATGVCYIREIIHKHTLMKSLLSSQDVEQSRTFDPEKTESTKDQTGDSHAQSDVRSFSLNLIVIAYDMGVPRSLNSSRKVRLVWNEQSPKDMQLSFQNHRFLKGIYGTYGLKVTRIEHLLIPLMIGALILLVVVCCILFWLARRRRLNKRTTASPINRDSKTGGSFNSLGWCIKCIHPALNNAELVGNESAKDHIQRKQSDDENNRKECRAATVFNEPCAGTMGQTNAESSKSYLPDCIPQTDSDLVSTPQHRQVGHLFINPSDWRTRSHYATSTLTRALSEESLNVMKSNDIGYTALCAFPSMQQEDGFFQRGLSTSHNRQSSLGFGQLFGSEGSSQTILARPIASRPQTLTTRQVAAPLFYNPLNLTSTCSMVYPTFHSTGYGLSPVEGETTQYEQFELGSGEQTDNPKPNVLAGAGWKPKLTEAYAENTFV